MVSLWFGGRPAAQTSIRDFSSFEFSDYETGTDEIEGQPTIALQTIALQRTAGDLARHGGFGRNSNMGPPMAKMAYPEFHKALLDQNLYPSSSRRIKFEETRYSYLFKSGTQFYKIRKNSPIYSSLAVKEVFAIEALRLSQRWAPENDQAVVPICKTGDSYVFSGDGEVIEYALRMTQLAGNHWASDLHRAGKLTPNTLGRLARYLATQHETYAAGDKTQDAGRPEHLRELFEEVSYQVKKYVGQTVSQPMFDMIIRPVEKFIDDSRKLFLRRQRRDRIVDGHGAFLPEHIFIVSKEVLAVSPLDGQQKYRILDAANDLAVFINEMELMGAAENAELFLMRYISATHDRELPKILPIYRTFQAMRSGLAFSEWSVTSSESNKKITEFLAKAHECFNLAVKCARDIPRSV